MPTWPGRESFENRRVNLSLDKQAREAFAKRVARALSDENVAEFARLSRQEPGSLFFTLKVEGQDSAPFDELRVKNSSFAFDAGLAWATAAGERWADSACQEKLKGRLGPLLESGIHVRMHALAFACGAIQAPLTPHAFPEWMFETGAKSHWLKQEFGAPELEIWGEEWARQAQERGTPERWCSVMLGQALIRGLEGAEQEMLAMIDAASGLAPPQTGWLSVALIQAKDTLAAPLKELHSQARREHSLNQATAIVTQWSTEKTDRLKELAVSLCAALPSSWTADPLAPGSDPELAAHIERARLEAASPRARSNIGGPKRV